jgi:hypothetical protein
MTEMIATGTARHGIRDLTDQEVAVVAGGAREARFDLFGTLSRGVPALVPVFDAIQTQVTPIIDAFRALLVRPDQR